MGRVSGVTSEMMGGEGDSEGKAVIGLMIEARAEMEGSGLTVRVAKGSALIVRGARGSVLTVRVAREAGLTEMEADETDGALMIDMCLPTRLLFEHPNRAKRANVSSPSSYLQHSVCGEV